MTMEKTYGPLLPLPLLILNSLHRSRSSLFIPGRLSLGQISLKTRHRVGGEGEKREVQLKGDAPIG